MLRFDCSTADGRRDGITAAVRALTAGELVVLPTDTAYALCADAFSRNATARLLGVKNRGREIPLSVFVASLRGVEDLVYVLPEPVRRLVDELWPGPLSVVLQHAPTIVWDLGDTRGYVTVRMPFNSVALEVVRSTGVLACTSATKGSGDPFDIDAIVNEFGPTVAVYLDSGSPPSTALSTIVAVVGNECRVVREGAIAVDQLREIVPEIVGT